MDPITKAFIAQMEQFAKQEKVPIVPFEKGQRKDDVAAEYRKKFTGSEGVLFIGKAQEKTPVFRTERRRNVRQRMLRMSAETVRAMFLSFAGYDTGASARQLRVPVRCINGDLFPTNIEVNRNLVADFDAEVLPHTGHFPMLERPEEFNRRLAEFAAVMTGPR